MPIILDIFVGFVVRTPNGGPDAPKPVETGENCTVPEAKLPFLVYVV